MLFYLLLGLSFSCPFLVFLDYGKRNNVYLAIVYVLAFISSWIFVLHPLIKQFGLYFAMAMPMLMIVFLLVAKKRKSSVMKKQSNRDIIDDL